MATREEVFDSALQIVNKEVSSLSKKKSLEDQDRKFLLDVMKVTQANKMDIDVSWAGDMSNDELMELLNGNQVRAK